MASVQESGRAMHQVRIGPLYNQDQIDNVKDTLQSNGLANFRLVEQ
jgi:rare lipoprotein A